MKKLNNKGITLVELIVSFMLVAVTSVYFFQCITVVKKMYTDAMNKTDEYVEKTYVLKLTDAYIDKVIVNNNDSNIKDLLNAVFSGSQNHSINLSGFINSSGRKPKILNNYSYEIARSNNRILIINIKSNNKTIARLFKYIPNN